MAVKVVQRPELTFWEKLYIPQILSGLKITFRHFFRNLFLHIAHRFGRLKDMRAGVTYQYPEELRPLFSRLRTARSPAGVSRVLDCAKQAIRSRGGSLAHRRTKTQPITTKPMQNSTGSGSTQA